MLIRDVVVKLNLEENPLYQKRLDQKAQENRQNLQNSENEKIIAIKRNYLDYIQDKDNSRTEKLEYQKER